MTDFSCLHERLADRVEADERGFTTPCWIWQGRVLPNGYGKVYVSRDRQDVLVHRLAHESAIGPIPEGLVVDHLCSVQLCVNPKHLEAVTQRENLRRSRNHVAGYMTATHCKHGHEFTDENTYAYRGKRACRKCRSRISRKYEEKKRQVSSV